MPSYLRCRVPGGSYSFTINLWDRRADLLTRHIDALRAAVRRTRRERPVHIDAWVVLPGHMHCMITLPEGDSDFSNRIKAIEIRFVRALPATEHRSSARAARGERGIWQRRFWEHAIRNQQDYTRHLGYVHYNPVKHGHVTHVSNWPFSTFHRLVQAGIFPIDRGGEGVQDISVEERKD